MGSVTGSFGSLNHEVLSAIVPDGGDGEDVVDLAALDPLELVRLLDRGPSEFADSLQEVADDLHGGDTNVVEVACRLLSGRDRGR